MRFATYLELESFKLPIENLMASAPTIIHTSNHTVNVHSFRLPDHPLPAISHRLNGIALPNPPCPHGPDVDYFDRHGGGNREPISLDDEPHPQQDPQNPLKNRVQLILEQMFYDILQESPNKKGHAEGSWTNIHCM